MKYVRWDFVILETPKPIYPLPLVLMFRYHFFTKIWQMKYILWITIIKNPQATWQSKETTAQSYQKVLNENNIKKSYGTEFVFFNCEIDNLAVWITHFYFLFMAYIHLQLNLSPLSQASTTFPATPLQVYILYGWTLTQIANLAKVRGSALPLNLTGTF